jgi:hypothetical protein
MLNTIFKGLFDSTSTRVISVSDFLLCMVVALAIGIGLALCYTFRNRCTKSFTVTLALLPAVVCVVIMAVNGNVGVGVAVAGAFGLVRFRSAPGSGREISGIFLAMGAGLMVGMGYLAYAVLFAIVLGAASMALTALNFGEKKSDALNKTLRITIPEDLDYTSVFEDLFSKYTKNCEAVSVKTANMGSMYKLTYDLTMKEAAQEKAFLDELRCRNGNLEISMSRQESRVTEL